MPDELILTLSFIAGLAALPGALTRRRFPTAGKGVFLKAGLAGLFLYLIWDLFDRGYEEIGTSIEQYRDEMDDISEIIELTSYFLGGILVGFGLLAWRELATRRLFPEYSGSGGRASAGPGAMTASEFTSVITTSGRRPRQLALRVAFGLGLHALLLGFSFGSFAEQEHHAFPTMLVLGFALYGLAEGFGFTNLFAAHGGAPTRTFRLALGLISGLPFFLAALAGMYLTEDEWSIAVACLGAGALTYTVIRLLSDVVDLGEVAKTSRRALLCWGVLTGLMAGFLLRIVLTVLMGSVE